MKFVTARDTIRYLFEIQVMDNFGPKKLITAVKIAYFSAKIAYFSASIAYFSANISSKIHKFSSKKS